eukprot:gene30435-35444_t
MSIMQPRSQICSPFPSPKKLLHAPISPSLSPKLLEQTSCAPNHARPNSPLPRPTLPLPPTASTSVASVPGPSHQSHTHACREPRRPVERVRFTPKAVRASPEGGLSEMSRRGVMSLATAAVLTGGAVGDAVSVSASATAGDWSSYGLNIL